MKTKGVAAAVLVVLMTTAFTGMSAAVSDNAPPNAGGNGYGGENGNGDRPDLPGSFGLNQSVVFGERVVLSDANYGIYPDGSLLNVDETYVNPMTAEEDDPWEGPMYSTTAVAMANWSDNLVLHEWDAGDKIRTEVILWDDALNAAVFTIRAGFLIEYFDQSLNDGLGGYVEIWSGTTLNGLWVDQQAEGYYSAEVNQVGCLLYGYNWDTAGCAPGTYRLTFSIGDAVTMEYPGFDEGDPAAGSEILSSDITIAGMVDPEMYGGEEPDGNYALSDYDYDADYTWIEIELH